MEIDAYISRILARYLVSRYRAGEINSLVDEYYEKYEILTEGRNEKEFREHVAVQAGIEIGFEKFLTEKNYHAIVTNFEMLSGLKQLPGLAIQRLMEKGYGFGGEGDWKTAAMVRLMKLMTQDIKKCKGYFLHGGLYLSSGTGTGGNSAGSYA
jgi:L-arabinose isomerase